MSLSTNSNIDNNDTEQLLSNTENDSDLEKESEVKSTQDIPKIEVVVV